MGTGEGMGPAKSFKPQAEQQQSANSYSEWAAAFQAYYGSGAQPGAGYYPSASGPQQHHPYMWGGQHMMPYGGPPPPYPAMYPPGTMFHPSMPPGAHPYGQFGAAMPPSAATDATTVRTKVQTNTNGDVNGVDGNGSGSVVKRSKSSVAVVPAASGGDTVKTGHVSADGGVSNSTSGQESGKDDRQENFLEVDGGKRGDRRDSQSMQSGDTGGSEDSSDSDEELGENGSQAYRKRTFGLSHTEGSGHGSARAGAIVPAANGGPTTTLGVGMVDYWHNSAAASSTSIGGGSGKGALIPKRAVASGAVVPIPPPPPPPPPSMSALVPTSARESQPEIWFQDEREVKRQRRKQSNRESARRSRMRKQAECEELGTRVETLTNENMTLRNEVSRLHEECKKLAADNASLKCSAAGSAHNRNGGPAYGKLGLFRSLDTGTRNPEEQRQGILEELRFMRDDRSRNDNGKGEIAQQATRASAAGEIWKKSLQYRKESLVLDTSNGGDAASMDRVTDAANGRGGNSDGGAGVGPSSPRGVERSGGTERRSRSPSRKNAGHHHGGSSGASRNQRVNQGMGSTAKGYMEGGEGYEERNAAKSPRGGSSLALDFGSGPETVAAG